MAKLLWVLCLFMHASTCGSQSTIGKEFVTGFFDVRSSTFKLDIASNASGSIRIFAPYYRINTTSSFNKTFDLTLQRNDTSEATGIQHSGVYIKSNVDISVYLTIYRGLENPDEDTFLSLPIDGLGTDYQIASFAPNHENPYPSEFIVIAPFDNTLVNVSFPNGTFTTKTLNRLDVYQETNVRGDLTGTIVHSTKPVSVVSGASCLRVLSGVGDCDILAEQMIPVDAFETHFIVPPIFQLNQSIVRIFSGQQNNVCMKDASYENCSMVRKNQWIESAPKRTTLVVTSQEPISVIQYRESQAYMTIIPGIRQFMNSYTFVVPNEYVHRKAYIAVTIHSSAMQTLRLDGRPPADRLVDKANVPSPFNEYTVLTFEITTGYHLITSTETNIVFGLIVFGYDSRAAYGFPGGINFESNRQLMCYSCDDLSDLELCDTVQRCAQRELCMVRHGSSKYTSGCASASICSTAAIPNGYCWECCNDDYCNYRGCGDTGIVPRSERGPICFDCNHALSVEQCTTVRPCQKREVCSIEEFEWVGHSHFKLGCVAEMCSAVEHGRSAPRCKSCCNEDFCNTNCTMGHGPSIIG